MADYVASRAYLPKRSLCQTPAGRRTVQLPARGDQMCLSDSRAQSASTSAGRAMAARRPCRCANIRRGGSPGRVRERSLRSDHGETRRRSAGRPLSVLASNGSISRIRYLDLSFKRLSRDRSYRICPATGDFRAQNSPCVHDLSLDLAGFLNH